jgi:hypothetical protein
LRGQGVDSIFVVISASSSPNLNHLSLTPQQQTKNMADNHLLNLATPPACIAGR